MKLFQVHDPSRIVLRRGLRVALVLPLTYLFVANVLHLDAGATYAVFGVFALLGICDFGGPTRDRAAAYLLTGAAGLIAIALGSALAYSPWSAIVGTFIVGALISFSTLLRGYVSSAQLGVLLPFVIAVTAPPAIGEVWQRLLAFAIAIVIATLSALLLWPSHTRSALRLRVGDCLAASANVVRALWPSATDEAHPVDLQTRTRELIEAHHNMRVQYDGHLLRPGNATARDRALLQMVDEVGRLRFFLRWQPEADKLMRAEDCQLARVTASSLDACADALQGDGEPPDPEVIDAAREAHRMSGEAWAANELASGRVKEFQDAVDASFHLRTSALSTELISRQVGAALGKPAAEPTVKTAGVIFEPPVAKTSAILKSNFTFRSPWFRLALRTGLALSIAVAVVAFGDLQHGFWVVLGTLTALRLDATGTGRTALQAIAGTVSGFVIGTALILVVGDYTGVMWALLVVAIFLAGFTPAAVSLPVGQASFTIFVILFYGILTGPTVQTGELRVLDVGIGLVISLIVSALIWPRGVAAKIRSTLQEAVHASTAALVASYDRLISGPVSDPALDAAAARAVIATRNACETFDLSIAQAGPATQFGDAWSMISNSARHISACANLVTFMARGASLPTHCPHVDDSMISCAHLAANSVNLTVDAIDPKFDNVRSNQELDDEAFMNLLLTDVRLDNLGEPFQRLESNVCECLEGAGHNTDPTDAAAGGRAISLIYARDWLLHVGWLAKRLSMIIEVPPTTASVAAGVNASAPDDVDQLPKTDS